MLMFACALPVVGIVVCSLSFRYSRKKAFIFILVYFLSPYFIGMLKKLNGAQKPTRTASAIHFNIGVPFFDFMLVSGLTLLMLSEKKEYERRNTQLTIGRYSSKDSAKPQP